MSKGIEITVDDENEIFYDETNCLIERESLKVVAGCSTSVIPSNIKIIGESSFSALDITEINIPHSVEAIEDFAFGYCDECEDFNYDGTIDEWKSIKLGTGWKSDALS